MRLMTRTCFSERDVSVLWSELTLIIILPYVTSGLDPPRPTNKRRRLFYFGYLFVVHCISAMEIVFYFYTDTFQTCGVLNCRIGIDRIAHCVRRRWGQIDIWSSFFDIDLRIHVYTSTDDIKLLTLSPFLCRFRLLTLKSVSGHQWCA